MATIPSYFIDFLKNVRLDEAQRDSAATAHKELRDRLQQDKELSPAIISSFLQGSYARSTIVKPAVGERADVDIVVVTRLHQNDYPRPEDAMKRFIPFVERYYPGHHALQGRSIGIVLPDVDLDLVITSAPSEAQEGLFKSLRDLSEFSLSEHERWEELSVGRMMVKSLSDPQGWETEPLFIPDRDAQAWQATHPIAQLQWTIDKNARCNGHYVNVVKAIKWWRRVNCPAPKYPKGYPVEHIIGMNCPDDIMSVADGVALSLEAIAAGYADVAARRETPFLSDHGVPEHNVMKRVAGEDFAEFHAQVVSAANAARGALDTEGTAESARLWQQLFGDEFPLPPEGRGDGYTPRTGGPSIVSRSNRFG